MVALPGGVHFEKERGIEPNTPCGLQFRLYRMQIDPTPLDLVFIAGQIAEITFSF